MTSGSIDFPENINWYLKVYEAPTNNTGVVISTLYSPQRNVNGSGVPNGITHACNDKVVLDNMNFETILFDDISIEVNDHVVLTCLANGYNVFSLLGNNDFNLTLPDNSIATSTMEFNNGLIIDGWFATALSDNRGEILISTSNNDYFLQPGQTVDLRISDLIFKNDFE
jgi:hypothetical protein